MILLRDATEQDQAFIRSSWFESYLKTVKPKVHYDVYKHGMDRHINELVLRSSVYVACVKSAPTQILGYAVVDKLSKALHYVYVKHIYRRQGIGSLLAKHSAPLYTHLPSREGELFFLKLNYEFQQRKGEAP